MDLDKVAEVLSDAFGQEPWPSPFRRHTGKIDILRQALAGVVASQPAAEADIRKTALILGSLVLERDSIFLNRGILESERF
jgi:hypothetical protein